MVQNKVICAIQQCFNAGLDYVFSMQCQNVLSTCLPVDMCACIGCLCVYVNLVVFFRAVIDSVKDKLCLN